MHLSLTTSNTSVSPSLDEVTVYYRESAAVRSGAALTLKGSKVIGTDLLANPIYKTTLSGTSDGSGALSFSDVEFDSYSLTPSTGLVVSTACPAVPLTHRAGVDSTLILVLRGSVPYSLRTTIVSQTGEPVPGATVTLSRTGFSESESTNLCGQVFIHSGVVAESDYDVMVQKAGFVTQTISAVSISGNMDLAITLLPQ